MAREIDQKVQTAPDFGTAFDWPTPKLGPKFDLAGFTDFESRASVVNQVWEALKDETNQYTKWLSFVTKVVARELRQLQHIEIKSCNEMEQIFYSNQPDHRNWVASIVRLSTSTVLNPIVTYNNDYKLRPTCRTPSSFIRCLRRKETTPVDSRKNWKMVTALRKEDDIN
ncbi:hypothetical protein M5689_012257 [Euphorbia peplus]|nr:hypothetical protein M5689_012257 [Euphorbia peplus]